MKRREEKRREEKRSFNQNIFWKCTTLLLACCGLFLMTFTIPDAWGNGSCSSNTSLMYSYLTKEFSCQGNPETWTWRGHCYNIRCDGTINTSVNGCNYVNGCSATGGMSGISNSNPNYDPWANCQCNANMGREICGDGRDNNNNGLVDEGCGNNQQCSSMTAGKPIHLQTGNMTLQHHDFSIQTGHIPINLSRTYNHQWENYVEYSLSRMGYGWRYSHQSRIVPSSTYDSSQQIISNFHTVVFADHSIVFKEQDGAYYSQQSLNYQLIYVIANSNNPNGCRGVATTCWVLISPQGIKYVYSSTPDRRLLLQEAPNGGYLLYQYKATSVYQYDQQLVAIKSYVQAPSSGGNNSYITEKYIRFHYYQNHCNHVSGNEYKWLINKIVLVSDSLKGSACSNDGDCTLWGGSCAKAPDDATGECGRAIMSLEYSYNQGICLLSKVYRDPSDTTKDFIEYKYNGLGWLTEAIDANGKILEKHSYDENINSPYYRKALTSESGDENISINYLSSTQAVVTSPSVSGYSRTVNFDPSISQMTSQTQSCSCSTPTTEQTWTTFANNPRPEHNFILKKSMKSPGQNTYQTWKYEFSKFFPNSSNSPFYISSILATHGDNNDNPDDVLPSNSKSLQVKTYHHPVYPGLTIATESDSTHTGKRLVIFDYGDPTDSQRCPDNNVENCNNISDYNKTPTGLLHRILFKGYTRTIANGTSSWVWQTRRINYEYDSMGRLSKIKGPTHPHQEITLTYNNYVSAQYPYTPSYTCDTSEQYVNSSYRLVSASMNVYNPLYPSQTSVLTVSYRCYDNYGRPTRFIDPNGVENQLKYDSLGRVIEVIREQSRTTTSPVFVSWKYSYDQAGRLAQIEHPKGSLTLYFYDTYGRLEKMAFKKDSSSSQQDLRKYTYDGLGRVLKVENLQVMDHHQTPLQDMYEYAFISTGPLQGGQEIKTYPSVPASGFILRKYHSDGNIAEITDQIGHTSEFIYDTERRWLTHLTRYQQPNKVAPTTIEYQYDKNGRLLSVKDANLVTTMYAWDDFDQLVEWISPDQAPAGTPFLFEYDQQGNPTKVRRPDQKEVVMLYDSLNRLVKIQYPQPVTSGSLLVSLLTNNDVEYTYDEYAVSSFGKGRLTSVKVHLLKDSSAPGGVWSRTTKYRHDAAGRIIEEQISDSSSSWTIPYFYDVESNLTEISYPMIPWAKFYYTYNKLNQLESVAQDFSPDILYRINKSYSTPQQIMAQKIHHSSWNSQTPSLPTYTRSTFNQQVFANIHPNGIWPPKPATVLASGSAVASDLQGHAGLIFRIHEYEPTGLLKNQACSSNNNLNINFCYPGNQSQSFEYDGLYRLKKAGNQVNGDAQFHFSYDANSNLTIHHNRAVGGTQWILEQVTGTNRLHRRYPSGDSSQEEVYQYHAGGERKEDAYWIYTYHSNGRLALMEPKNTNLNGKYLIFVYDHLGRRVSKLVYSGPDPATSTISQTHYSYDGYDNLIEELEYPDLSQSSIKYQFWAWHQNELMFGGKFSVDNQNNVRFLDMNYYLDRLGRPTAVGDLVGRPVWRSDAQPYGLDEGISLNRNAWEEIDISSNPILLNSSTANTSRSILKPGSYAIQFYFEQLQLGGEQFWISIPETSNNFKFFNFTGTYSIQSGAQGFWGPVLRTDVQEMSASSTNPEISVFFNLTPWYYPLSGVAKITKYRLWNVASGESEIIYPNDSPPLSNGVYQGNVGQGGTQPWTRTYTRPAAQMLMICFDNFDVEYYYDYVQILDKNNQIVEVMTGESLGYRCSSWVQGDTATVRFYTDSSVERGGFTISRVEALYPSTITARLPGQWYEPDTEVRDTTGNLKYAGLHYNWHRYYDPNVGRYITPDPLGLEAGMNLYSYAANDPVNNIDPDGLDVIIYWWPISRIFGLQYPHMGIAIDNPDLNKARGFGPGLIYASFGPNRDSTWGRNIIPGPFNTAGIINSETTKGNAFRTRYKTSLAEDFCIYNQMREGVLRCEYADKFESLPMCRFAFLISDCRHWVHGITQHCGVDITYIHRVEKDPVCRGVFSRSSPNGFCMKRKTNPRFLASSFGPLGRLTSATWPTASIPRLQHTLFQMFPILQFFFEEK